MKQLCNKHVAVPQIIGFIIAEGPVNRNKFDQKEYVPHKKLINFFYPKYCSGIAYLLTFDVVTKLLEYAPKHRFLHIEDALFTGLISDMAGVERVHNRHFYSHRVFLFRNLQDCSISPNQVMATHLYTSDVIVMVERVLKDQVDERIRVIEV